MDDVSCRRLTCSCNIDPLSPVRGFTGGWSAGRRAPELSVWACSIHTPGSSGLFLHLPENCLLSGSLGSDDFLWYEDADEIKPLFNSNVRPQRARLLIALLGSRLTVKFVKWTLWFGCLYFTCISSSPRSSAHPRISGEDERSEAAHTLTLKWHVMFSYINTESNSVCLCSDGLHYRSAVILRDASLVRWHDQHGGVSLRKCHERPTPVNHNTSMISSTPLASHFPPDAGTWLQGFAHPDTRALVPTF